MFRKSFVLAPLLFAAISSTLFAEESSQNPELPTTELEEAISGLIEQIEGLSATLGTSPIPEGSRERLKEVSNSLQELQEEISEKYL